MEKNYFYYNPNQAFSGQKEQNCKEKCFFSKFRLSRADDVSKSVQGIEKHD